MTTLAAIQGDGWCVIGADTLASDDDGFSSEMRTSKVFKNGIALIAGAGSVRGLNILEFGWNTPAYGSSKSIEHYLTRTFVPSMRSCFIEAGYDMKSDKDVAEQDNDLIVAIKGELFSIAGDYSWDRCARGLFMAGSGGKYALGALAALGADKAKSIEQAQSMMHKAITHAIRWDVFSGGRVETFVQEA